MQLDERGFNIFYPIHQPTNEYNKIVVSWMMNEFSKMKYSNPKYGTYEHSKNNNGHVGKEGKATLNAHELILWLNKNKPKYEKNN